MLITNTNMNSFKFMQLKRTILATFLLGLCTTLIGQVDTSKLYELPTVTLQVPRLEGRLLGRPMAVTSLQSSAIFQSQQQLSINEYLNEVPGLFALNPSNFAQDLRVSIRGFGARAAFGIRGVKILVDGIPETTPDGQGQTDNLDLGIVDRLEILRGPSSGLYGNAAGGVISISTQSKVERPFLELGTTLGSFNLQQYQVKTGFKTAKSDYIFHVSDTQTDGYRDNSGMKSTTWNGQVLHQFAEETSLKLILNYTDSPQADDPGGINAAGVTENRRQARDRNLLFKAGESIDQFKIAALLKHKQLSTNVFFSNRNFYGLLPFGNGGIIDLKRNYWGHGLQYTLGDKNLSNDGGISHRFQLGYSIAQQIDERERFINLEGKQGDTSFDQTESFSNVGLFLLEEIQLPQGWSALLSLRYDWNQLEATDRFLSNGDDSGDIQLSSFNPSIGINYEWANDTHLYGQFSTSFETPALSELSNNPDGEGGFNAELLPQRAQNIEFGLKGVWQGKWQYDLAYFHIRTKDEIVSFELADFPGRDFFRNAGETVRNGIETNVLYAFAKRWRLNLTYTYSDFSYLTYINGGNDFTGNELPGLPKHFGSASIRYIAPGGFFARLQTRFVGELFANDANTVTDPGYTLVNLNLGYDVGVGKWKFMPFIGLNNALDATYNDNIRINAFGGRYFEPAAGTTVFGGLRIRKML